MHCCYFSIKGLITYKYTICMNESGENSLFQWTLWVVIYVNRYCTFYEHATWENIIITMPSVLHNSM